MKKVLITLILSMGIQSHSAELLTIERALSIAVNESENAKIVEDENLKGKEQISEFVGYTRPRVDFSTKAMYVDNSAMAQANQFGMDIGALFGDSTSGGFVNRLRGMNYSWNLSASQTLNVFKIYSTSRMAAIQKEMVSTNFKNQFEEIKLDVISAYWDALIAKEEMMVNVETEKWQKDQLLSAEIQLQSGLISKVNYNLIKSMLTLTQAQKRNNEENYKLKLTQLKTLIGLETEVELSTELDFDLFAPTEVDQVENNRELKMLTLQSELNEQNAFYNETGYYPELELIGSMSNNLLGYDDQKFSVAKDYLNPDYFSYALGLQLTWNLFQGGTTVAQVEQIKADARIQKRKANLLKKELDAQLEALIVNLKTMRDVIEAQEVYAQNLEISLESDRLDFKNGNTPIGSVIQSEENYLNARKQLFESKRNWMLAAVNYQRLTGQIVLGENK